MLSILGLQLLDRPETAHQSELQGFVLVRGLGRLLLRGQRAIHMSLRIRATWNEVVFCLGWCFMMTTLRRGSPAQLALLVERGAGFDGGDSRLASSV